MTDSAGVPATGLTPADFTVTENGQRRRVLGVTTSGAPSDITVLLDKFVEGDTRQVASGIESLAAAMPEACRVALMSIGGAKAALLLDHTADRRLLSESLARLPFLTQMNLDRRYLGGEPQRYPVPEGLRAAVSGLADASHQSGEVLLVATETWIRDSGLREPDLVNVRDRGMRLDAVFVRRDLRPGMPDLPPDLGASMTDLFDRGTRLAGGRMETVASPPDLVGVLRSLAVELRGRYLVTFSSGAPGSHIEVELAEGHSKLKVRTTVDRQAGPSPR